MNIEFITAAQNIPFAVSMGLFFLMAIIEIVGAVMGFGVSALFDSLDIDLDLDFDVDASASFMKFLAWLRFGKVPFVVLLFVFLTGFGITGFMIQAFSQQLFGSLFSAITASFISLLFTLPLTRTFGGLIAQVMPHEETSALKEDSFIGKKATITLGEAKKGSPAQAKFRDEFGQTHYLMIEPEEDEVLFEESEEVEILEKRGGTFVAKKISKEVKKKEVLLETI